MRLFYNTHRKIFYSFFFLLFLGTGLANAQTFTFTYEDACVPSPACAEDGTSFKEDENSTATSWAWNFGDGGTGDVRNPLHSYKTAGPYTVTLIRTFANGSQTTESQQINIGEVPPPFQQWKSDTTICPNTSLVLDPYPNGAPEGAKYIWYPKGDTTQTLEVDSSGCYSVEVIMPNGCKLQDRVNVKICMEPANQEGAKWFFGGNAGLDFSSSPPAPITDGKVNTPEGSSSIANSKGVLQFYSDGIRIYNRDNEEMQCAFSGTCEPLKGSPSSTQSVLIVPQPTCKGCEYLFNVFTTTEIEGSKFLTKSVVDMRLNFGKGEIIEQNTTLQQPTTERIAAVQNKRDSTYWVISHDYGTNKFRIFHATTGGLTETSSPELGMAHDSPNEGEGYMKFSAADSTGARQLAVIIPGPPTNYVELFNFNDSTGVLTYNKTIDLGPAPPTAYGIEFSPSGEKMYVSFQGEGSSKSYLKQFDLTFSDSLIVESAIVIDSSATEKYGALQIAPDGKIYMAIEGSDYLASIGEPERNSVSAIEYEKEGVNLGGKKSQLGLPSMVQDFTQEASGPGFSADGFCTNEPTNFEAGPICDPLKDNMYIWDFGDGNGGSSQEAKISHTYTQPGSYIVSLSQSNACTSIVTKDTIVIYETPPQINLGPDKDTCGAYVPLDMGVNAEIYEWYNRGRIIGRSKTIRITATGRYLAVAYNGPDADCFSIDTIEVTLRKPPPFSIGPDTTMCRDSSILITAPGLTWREFLWNTGEDTRSITVRQPGTYFVQVKNGNDCYNYDTLQVAELPSPILRLAPEYYICVPDGGSTILDANGIGVIKYEWPHSNETTQAVTVNKEGVYTVLATNEEGCVARQSTSVLDQCEPRFFIPDAFTPDGDGKNENLDVFGAYYINYSIRIYNRWGEVIYATTSIEDKWDGTYKGVKVQPGVYPYVVSYEAQYFPERNPVVLRGSVMVIR
ncbi:gliding motility-associated C-terminal domain-containing protein [Dyadobacter koreensis]|uniref:Gliding motility-associated C-terminal domain-containing protein n=1 Tax=Dyadobacter koreensis TaxID=408657 RepID=A0A1H6ZUS3_9BACT|nr:PKD domain-containing protein [Dyadobacter koreensis]SEJ56988.1 gliding motility-associated C-terminal domain-containing protein [Dyadobacter koreensis]